MSLAELNALGLTREEVIDFSVNINPLGPPPGVAAALSRVNIAAYPDPECREIREMISRLTGVSPGQIVIGNGSTELIHLLAHTYLGKGSQALIMVPTFAEYETAARLAGAGVVLQEAVEENDFIWDMSAVCREVRHRQPGLVFLCQPNNPTGRYLEREAVESLAEAAGQGLLVLDEAYISFVYEAWDSCQLLSQGNVVVLRSMTKDYALTGLRLGYALCPAGVARALSVSKPSWSVNAVAQAAGLTALADREHLLRGISCVQEGRGYLHLELGALGYKVLPSVANFLLVKVGGAAALRKRLLRRGVCVRDCTSFGLSEYIRIGVRTLPECQRLLEVLREVK
ncbi:MAG TPA: histidinol-phosphate aminotransferase family protein [Dehalococcoidia bacterium]|nr:histidinol-phosphate aminotransferase family protein [Dehalococcoidia bacterium]